MRRCRSPAGSDRSGANSPDFKDLATTGYWRTYYGDEELVRWSFELMRHYAVEGNTEMLSDLHRIVFRPASPAQVVAFHDEQAAPGEELIINFVQLKPYLE